MPMRCAVYGLVSKFPQNPVIQSLARFQRGTAGLNFFVAIGFLLGLWIAAASAQPAPQPSAADVVPTFKFTKGVQVSIEEADRILRGRTPPAAAQPAQALPSFTGHFALGGLTGAAATGCAAGSSQPPEIVTP